MAVLHEVIDATERFISCSITRWQSGAGQVGDDDQRILPEGAHVSATTSEALLAARRK